MLLPVIKDAKQKPIIHTKKTKYKKSVLKEIGLELPFKGI